ncbi:hypothetical protein AAMO2058_000915300 [Amorphochlora amoebiformis]
MAEKFLRSFTSDCIFLHTRIGFLSCAPERKNWSIEAITEPPYHQTETKVDMQKGVVKTPDGKEVLVIDVRSEDEAKHHGILKGSSRVRCDITSTGCVEKGIAAGLIPEDAKKCPEIVVYCKSGRRAGRFAEMLKERGYSVKDYGKLEDLAKKYGIDHEHISSKTANVDGKKILIVDVRSENEAKATGVLKGAVRSECSISATNCVDNGIKKGVIPPDPKNCPPIVVFCKSGRRAARFAGMLKEKGYTILETGGIYDLEKKYGIESEKKQK